MTVGQRIAQKRKELGLSQEALGERLGVSRQAIYKWESDAALPEIEKLVNLSREFGVSVGWLLGEEDNFPERPELTAEQLRMVEEIVGRYLDARPPERTVILPETAGPEEGGEPENPEPPKPRRRRWPRVLAAGTAVLVVIGVFSNLFSRLDQMRQENQSLQMAVANIRSDVNSEIYSTTRRVEEVLQSQNALTAEQSAQVVDLDYRANTVTIEARVVPRTYVEGVTAQFAVVSGGETVNVTGELGENHAFTARITAPLTDQITVSAAFLNGEQRQTQVLAEFTDLYNRSFSGVAPMGGVSRATKVPWTSALRVPIHRVEVYTWNGGLDDAPDLASVRVGIFQDQKLMAWLTEEGEGPKPTGERRFFRLEEETIWMEAGHIYCIAAVVEDEAGRKWVEPENDVYTVTEDGMKKQRVELSRDPADWEY